MIIDSLANAHLYYPLGKNYETGLRYLKDNYATLATMPIGTHEIVGKDVYLIMRSYDSFPLAECKLENHKKYADIQLVLKGKELFGYCRADRMELYESHDDRDVYYYRGDTDAFVLKDDLFVVVPPFEGHMPDRAVGEKREPIIKAVIKVRVE